MDKGKFIKFYLVLGKELKLEKRVYFIEDYKNNELFNIKKLVLKIYMVGIL